MGDVVDFPGISGGTRSDEEFKAKIVKSFNTEVSLFIASNMHHLTLHNVPINQVRNIMLAGAITAMAVIDEEILAQLFIAEFGKDGS